MVIFFLLISIIILSYFVRLYNGYALLKQEHQGVMTVGQLIVTEMIIQELQGLTSLQNSPHRDIVTKLADVEHKQLLKVSQQIPKTLYQKTIRNFAQKKIKPKYKTSYLSCCLGYEQNV